MAAKCKTNFVAALSIMARRRSEPYVRPAIGGPRACSRRSLRRAPRFACLPQAGIRVSRPGKSRAAIFTCDAKGWKIKNPPERRLGRVRRKTDVGPRYAEPPSRAGRAPSTGRWPFDSFAKLSNARCIVRLSVFREPHVREGGGFYAQPSDESRARLEKGYGGA
jgi:hypothetical protein